MTGIVRRKILCDDEGKNLLRASRLSFLYPWDFKGISEPVNHKFQTCHLGLSVSMLSLSVSTLSAVRFYAVIIVQSSKNRIPTFLAVNQMLRNPENLVGLLGAKLKEVKMWRKSGRGESYI